MHPTTVVSPFLLLMAGLTVASGADDYIPNKPPKVHKGHGRYGGPCKDGCHDKMSLLLEHIPSE